MFSKQIEFIDNFQTAQIVTTNARGARFDSERLIIEKQLFDKGIDGTGRLEGYTCTTIRYKIAKGYPQTTTLKDEGNFHASITIKAFSDTFEIGS